VLAAAARGWHSVFIVAAVLNAAAALMAWFVLRPMRRAKLAGTQEVPAGAVPVR
jgi:OFA family oxalate/formate antiporter-like MFS transporter